jgi:hypothetical protein
MEGQEVMKCTVASIEVGSFNVIASSGILLIGRAWTDECHEITAWI